MTRSRTALLAVAAITAMSLLSACSSDTNPVAAEASVASAGMVAAQDTAMQQDANTLGQAVANEINVSGSVPNLSSQIGAATIQMSDGPVYLQQGDILTAYTTSGTTFCLAIGRSNGAAAGSQAAWVFNSAAGGLQAAGVTSC